MGDRYINNSKVKVNDKSDGNYRGNGIDNGNCNDNDNDTDNSKIKSIREPASQMVKHDQRSIGYIDANKLCDYAVMQNLPYRDFKYIDTSLNTILNTPDDSDQGY